MFHVPSLLSFFIYPLFLRANYLGSGEHCRLSHDYYDFNDDGDGCSSSSPLPYYHHFYRQQQHYSPPTSPAPPNCSVIATVRAWLSHERGGRLESVETGVALIVPPGALPVSPASHLVYFKVCRQERRPVEGANGPCPLDEGKGTRRKLYFFISSLPPLFILLFSSLRLTILELFELVILSFRYHELYLTNFQLFAVFFRWSSIESIGTVWAERLALPSTGWTTHSARRWFA